MDGALGFITSLFFSLFFFAIVIFNLHFHFKPLCIYCFKPGKLICSLPVPQKSKICRIEMQKEKNDAILRVTCDSHTAGHLLSINLLFHYSDKCDLKKKERKKEPDKKISSGFSTINMGQTTIIHYH